MEGDSSKISSDFGGGRLYVSSESDRKRLRMVTLRTLYQFVSEEAKISPQSPAILSPEKDALSYEALSRQMRTIALQLSRLGFRPHDRLALVMPNGPEMATAFLSISSICACIPLNPSNTLEDFKFSFLDMHIKALMTTPGSDQPGHKAAEELGLQVIELHPDPRTAGIFQLESALPMDWSISEPILAGLGDEALVLHTSGTTSRPKIVPITHQNIFYSVQNISSTYALSPADRCLNIMPLFHIHGLMASMGASLLAGASIICAPGYQPERVLGWLSELAPTWYTAVPTIHQSILEQANRQPENVGRVHLRFIRSCSSPLAPQVAQDLESAFNAPVVEAYGMTEATHQIASNPLPPQVRKLGSVGLPTGTTRVSIKDEKGKNLPPNSIGEICLRGENVISGYENNPTANTNSFDNGWLRTGDLGFLDEDGYLFIQGRLKEIINRAGEKISPREIDEVLLEHPAVRQAVAFAVAHPSLGEDVAAAVVLKDGHSVSMQELRRFTSERLADFKVPRRIIFLQEIPKGPTGKIQRIGLAEMLRKELEITKAQEVSGIDNSPTMVEAELLSIWEKILGIQTLNLQDDFLVLGGDSIKAARILMLVNERFNTNLSMGDIFSAPTIATMASLVEEKRGQNN